jgi:hypothetical protein
VRAAGGAPLGHDDSLTRTQLDHPVLQIDPEPSVDDVEELVIGVVPVPVDPTECLVLPPIGARGDERGNIDALERAEFHVQVC